MQMRLDASEWPKTVWKVVTNPAIEVIAAIVVVLLAAWVVVQTDVEQRAPVLPVISGVK
ncbi:MAG TPA: hypothetical protein VFP36_13695 [Usitatibacter sp.]|nr:hypothetical protein [Usitatibacter sp.]